MEILIEQRAIDNFNKTKHGIKNLNQLLPIINLIHKLKQIKHSPQNPHNILPIPLPQIPSLQSHHPHNIHTLNHTDIAINLTIFYRFYVRFVILEDAVDAFL